jgi:2-methylisocitrate lyase-like PEP mutase family enzyme
MLQRIATIAAAVRVPVSADVEAGYSDDVDGVAATIQGVIAAGAVGANLEDADDGSQYEIDRAAERVMIARAAADRTGVPFTLNARIDSFLVGHPDPLADAIGRAARYVDAGADCIFIPGIKDEAFIARAAEAIDAPLNVVAGLIGPSLDVSTYSGLGVRRISIGGSLARTTLGLVRRAAHDMRDGHFTFAADAIPHVELNELMGR